MVFQVFMPPPVRSILEPSRWDPLDFASASINPSENYRLMQASFAPPGYPFAASGRSENGPGLPSFAVDRYYVEFQIVTGGDMFLGIALHADDMGFFPGYHAKSYGYRSNGQKFNNASGAAFGDSFTTGDYVGMAIDLSTRNIWFSKNGTWQASGDPAAGLTPAFTLASSSPARYELAFGFVASGCTVRTNFGNASFVHQPPNSFAPGWGR